jgi:hypothetical protein
MSKIKFKDLTDEMIEQFRLEYVNRLENDLTVEKLAIKIGNELNLSERTVRKWFKKLNFKEKVDIEPEQYVKAKEKKHDKSKKRFIITSAQSGTPVNKNFINNIEAYADYINAEILVIPFRYKNPTSVFTNEQKDNEWWDNDIVKYLTLNRHNLNKCVSVLSDVPIQPTASNPLLGLEGMTSDHSCVIGHPRFELKVIPVMDGCKPKIMFTTGCCTKSNYTSSKAGKKGEFHHSIGFAVIEIKDDETFFFRQVVANEKTGEFIDLFYHVHNGEINRETEVEACAMGDIHVAHVDKEVVDLTLNNLFKKLKPKKLFIHDIMDSESISHHNLKDPFKLHQMEISGRNSLSNEVEDMLNWLEQIKDYNVYIVKSNHDTHIDQFLASTDWRKMTTFKNALPYMEYATAMLKGDAPNGIVPYIINKKFPNFKCLTDDCNVTVKGFLMSVHGHLGASGSRGSVQQFSRLSTKSVTGHSHTISRIGGAVSVGTSTHLRVGYNKSFSNWVQAHGIVNRLGKFQHIVFFKTKDGLEYTTLDK